MIAKLSCSYGVLFIALDITTAPLNFGESKAMPGKKMSKADAFNAYRTQMNERIWAQNNKVINRLFNLDQNTYAEGALSTKIKEMMGLVASMSLRCEDCIHYHLGRCHELGVSNEEMLELFSVATVVGGTIMIPHLRRALEYWQELRGEYTDTTSE